MKRLIENINIVHLLLILAVLKLLLIDRGAFSSSDEWEYLETFYALKALQNLDFKAFCMHIASANAIPINATVKIIPVSLQFIVYNLYDLPIINPHSIRIVIIFNIIVSLLSTFVFYKILVKRLNDNTYALLGTVVFAFLATNFAYIRHILPYDLSLLIFLYAFYKGLSLQNTTGQLLLGILAMCGFLAYTGYYYLTPVIYILLIDYKNILSIQNVKATLWFGLGALIPLMFFEMTAQIGGVSLIMNLYSVLTTSLDIGNSVNSFVYIFYYAWDSEHLIGILMLVLGGWAYVHLIKSKSLWQSFHVSLILLISMYLFHATLEFFFHDKVFWGRVVRGYFPFLILLTFDFLYLYKRLVFPQILAVIGIFQFALFFPGYLSLSYPRDVLYKQGIMMNEVSLENRINQFPEDFTYQSPEPWNVDTQVPYRKTEGIKLINFAFLAKTNFDITEEYIPREQEQLIYEGVHFLNEPIYMYDEYNFDQITRLKQEPLELKIYKQP